MFLPKFLSKPFNAVLKIAAPIINIASTAFPVLKPVAIAANIVKSLTQDPPDWKGALMGAVSALVPRALNDVIKHFPGGDSMKFASMFQDKMKGELNDQLKRVLADTTLSQATRDQMAKMLTDQIAQVGTQEFQKNVAAAVDKATGLPAGSMLTSAILMQHKDAIKAGVDDLTTGPKGTVNSTLGKYSPSTYSGAVDAPINIPPALGNQINSTAPVLSPSEIPKTYVA